MYVFMCMYVCANHSPAAVEGRPEEHVVRPGAAVAEQVTLQVAALTVLQHLGTYILHTYIHFSSFVLCSCYTYIHQQTMAMDGGRTQMPTNCTMLGWVSAAEVFASETNTSITS